MRYFIIAGEASGDLHGSNLVKALRAEEPTVICRGWGGDLMAAAGCVIQKQYKELAFMGFYEVVKNLGTILQNFKLCKRQILDFQPDALVLIDYPGFNLRMAKWAKSQGIKVFYYISPQIWAWHTSRVHQIKKNIDKMFVILPFEQAFYQKYDVEVSFVGHPLLDHIANFRPDGDFKTVHQLQEKPVIALLPGSRKQEIEKMLDIMLSVVPKCSDYVFVIAGAPSIPLSFYKSYLEKSALTTDQFPIIIQNDTYNLLAHSHAALVTSGTATLETALFDVPQVVCYTGNPLSYQIAKRIIDLEYISLVNLILNRQLVTELIQSDFTTEKTLDELNNILDKNQRSSILDGYRELRSRLGNVGASERAAKEMIRRT